SHRPSARPAAWGARTQGSQSWYASPADWLDWKVGEVVSCNCGDTDADGGIGDHHRATPIRMSLCRVGPGNFTPSRSQIPDLILSHHPARATARRLPPSVECWVPTVAG